MGDEYGEYGGGDPDNRHMFRQGDALNTREQTLLNTVKDVGTVASDCVRSAVVIMHPWGLRKPPRSSLDVHRMMM